MHISGSEAFAICIKPFGFYVYIGITLSDYILAPENPKINVGSCLNSIE